jgi:hypothetical protein
MKAHNALLVSSLNHLRLSMRMYTCMSCQLTAHTYIPFTSFQIVNGTNVVQATAGHIVPRRGICTGHDPGGAQWDGVDLNDKNTDEANTLEFKSITTTWACRCLPVIPVIQEARAGRSPVQGQPEPPNETLSPGDY